VFHGPENILLKISFEKNLQKNKNIIFVLLRNRESYRVNKC